MEKARDKYNSEFATRLRNLMEERKVTQQALADETNLTRQAISQYADGSVLPNIERLLKIANYFGVSCDYMLGNTDVKKLDITIQQIAEYTGLTEDGIEFLHKKHTTPKVNSKYQPDYSSLLPGVISSLFLYEDDLKIFENIYTYLMTEVEGLPFKYYADDYIDGTDEELQRTFMVNNKMNKGTIKLSVDLVPFALLNSVVDSLKKARALFTWSSSQWAEESDLDVDGVSPNF